ncbi:MAG: hypothetical protein KME12_24830 [Trichocoleus desertorum ATA4-8-CV12]|jgi:hypothetical protein|nr:hypothetical protein [Trichocoleus desertorum ATA4-8-CV12]
MSILNFPYIYFQGYNRTHAPTGHKNGVVDLSTNTVYLNGDRVACSKDSRLDHRCSVSEHHESLYRTGPRFNAEGQWDENGLFSIVNHI